jgi:hypothetical protein
MRWCSPALLNIAMMCEIADGRKAPWAQNIDGALTAHFLRFTD